MSKTNDSVLLIPGESGWEVWTSQGGADFSFHSASGSALAGEIPELPPGDTILLFPVKSLTAVPMRVTSSDDSLFPDLTALHAERLGIRPDPMAGQLTDQFVFNREAESAALVAIFLKSPGDGELPTRSPKGFDISPRAFPVTGNTLAIWKEFGRWVFGVFTDGKLMYCQATADGADHPDEALAREIRLAIIQLGMQGMNADCARIVVWSEDRALNVSALRAAFTASVEVHPRPVPHLPDPLSKLLPADVRAARRAALQRRNILLGSAAVAAIYLGLIGWLAFGLWQTSKETRSLAQQAEEMAPEGEAYATHIAKWDELAPAIDLKNSPVDILKRIADSIPPNSGLRLKTAEISGTEIRLIGEAPALQAVNTFSLRLTKNNGLAHFTWQTPEPNQSTRGWEFVFNAEIPTQTQP